MSDDKKTEEFIAWLKNEVDQLQGLLNDPQPGLASWCIMFAERMNKISTYWKQGYDVAKDSVVIPHSLHKDTH